MRVSPPRPRKCIVSMYSDSRIVSPSSPPHQWPSSRCMESRYRRAAAIALPTSNPSLDSGGMAGLYGRRRISYNYPMGNVPEPTAASARERSEALGEVLAERVLVLDGATGTWIQGEDLTAADFGGEEYEGCNEHLVLTRPDVVRRMHASYFEAGADMVETDTFGGTPLVLAEYGLAEKAFEI